MLILTQYNDIVNLDKFRKIEIISDTERGKWRIWAIEKGAKPFHEGDVLGDYEHYTTATETIADIIKKAEVGCKTYVMPKEQRWENLLMKKR